MMAWGMAERGIFMYSKRCHVVVQVEVFYVHNQAFGSVCAGDTVEHDFCCDETSCLGADIIGVFNLVTANSVAVSTGFGLVGAVCTDWAEVGGLPVCWHFGDGDEVDCVCAFGVFVSL